MNIYYFDISMDTNYLERLPEFCVRAYDPEKGATYEAYI